MKEYVLVNNPQEMDTLLSLYKQLQWRATVSGLNYKMSSSSIYPVVVGHQDDYSWYLNDHGNDGKKYHTVDKVIHMHNSFSYQKKLYIPYEQRAMASFRSNFSIFHLKDLQKEGKLTSDSVGVRYVEKSQPPEARGRGDMNSWKHFDCELKTFNKVNFSTIDSYTQVGKPNFHEDKRGSNNLSRDYWEITVNLPGSYESHSEGIILEKYLEITDYNTMDPMNGCCMELRLSVQRESQPSNYIYYTLL